VLRPVSTLTYLLT